MQRESKRYEWVPVASVCAHALTTSRHREHAVSAPHSRRQQLRECGIVRQRHGGSGSQHLAVAALHVVLLQLARVPHIRILLVRLERNQFELRAAENGRPERGGMSFLLKQASASADLLRVGNGNLMEM